MVKHNIITAVFNCNYSCNDNCDFCFNAKDINKSPEMSLSEIQDNYFYIRKKYGINNIIISGGEPSLYSHFWKMMEFFYWEIDKDVRPALNTNSLNFVEQDMYEKLLNLLKRATRSQKQLSLSFSTVNSIKNPTPKEKLKIKGITNTIKAGLLAETRVLIPIAITKTNYIALPEIADFLISFTSNYKNISLIEIQLRGLFLDRYMNSEQIQKTVPYFQDTLPYIVSFLKKILNSPLQLKIFNLPLCHLMDNIDLSSYITSLNSKAIIELRMKIDYKIQFSKIKPNIFLDTAYKAPPCEYCSLNNKCNKVQKEYIELGFMPDLKTTT